MVEPKTDDEIALSNAVKKGLEETKRLLSLNCLKFNNKRYFDYHLIIKALSSGRIELAKLLIEKGCRVYKASKSNQEKTVLHAAIELWDQELVETLLAKGASSDILNYDEKNKTPLHLAIDMNWLAVIELLLSQFDAKVFDEKYLLHYAVEQGDIKILSKFISKGLSLNKKNDKNLTPFCIASNNKYINILDFLLSNHSAKNIKPNDYNDLAPAYIAVIHGNLKVIKKYVQSGLSINTPIESSKGRWPCLDEWISQPGLTLLHIAVKLVKLKIVKYLLSSGADILIKNESGSTPLHIAFEAKEIGIWKTWQEFDDNNTVIDVILKANMKLKFNPINKHGLTHFHIACSQDKPTVVEHFLELDGTLINQPVSSKCHRYKKLSPLHIAAKFRCKKSIKVLLNNEADVKQKDFQKMTALHVAAKESCPEVVRILLEYDASISCVDSNGNTPVHLAFENKNYKIIDWLLSVPNVANSNPTNSDGISHFHIACTRNNVDVVKSFIESGVSLDSCIPAQSDKDSNSHVADWIGYSPLHFAVSHNRAKIVELLLDSGANVEIKNSRGFNPFHLACQYTGEMFGEFLENILGNLRKHRKITQQQQPLTDIVSIDEKHTSKFSGFIEKLDWSAHRKDYLKIINFLLDHGSDVNSTDDDGNTPIFYAYEAIMKARSMLEPNLDCSKDFFEQIVESLSTELYERRKFILNHLVDLGANLDECFQHSSILNAIARNYLRDVECNEMTKWSLSKGANINARNNEMLTPLLQAIIDRRSQFILKLLEYGASVDCTDPRDNSTPLLLAISRFQNWSSQDVIRALVMKGANLHARRSDGFTALHLACEIPNFIALQTFLFHGADINIEDNARRSVCCYFYERHLNCRIRSTVAMWTWEIMQKHIIKMSVIGLPISDKVMSSNSQFDGLLTKPEKKELYEKYQIEAQLLRDTKINDIYTLHDVIFKDENSLSQLVKNPAFKAIVNCESFEKKYIYYGYLMKLKYEAGVNRGKLLPTAKILINQLAGMHLPEMCAENICKYFNNSELKECLENLNDVFDSNVDSSKDVKLINRRRHKRLRVD